MALIKCPVCGKEVSEKARVCVHCGHRLIEEALPKKFCSECGKEISFQALECPFCGCPVEKDDGNDISSRKNEKVRRRNFIILGGIVFVAFILAVVLVIRGFGPGLNEDEKLAYKNAVTMQSRMKDPDSFKLYDEMFLLKYTDSEGKPSYTYTIFRYGRTNSYGRIVIDRAVFKDEDYIMDYDDKPEKGTLDYREKIEVRLDLVYFETVGETKGCEMVEIDIDKIKEKMKLK